MASRFSLDILLIYSPHAMGGTFLRHGGCEFGVLLARGSCASRTRQWTRLPTRVRHMANSKEIHLAGEVLDRAWHICALFHSQEEAYRVLLPFIRQGFDQGNRAAHIVDPREREEHLRRLQQAGIDVAEAERRDQLVVRSWDNSYLQDGFFDPDRTICLAERAVTRREGAWIRTYPIDCEDGVGAAGPVRRGSIRGARGPFSSGAAKAR